MGRARLREKGKCHYCKRRPGITIDHIVPRAFGGPDAIWNYVSSCETCNLEKGSSWPDCPCDYCTNAVTRFLSNPDRRERTLARLSGQADELSEGIVALNRRAKDLAVRRRGLHILYSTIVNWPTDDEVLVELVVKEGKKKP